MIKRAALFGALVIAIGIVAYMATRENENAPEKKPAPQLRATPAPWASHSQSTAQITAASAPRP